MDTDQSEPMTIWAPDLRRRPNGYRRSAWRSIEERQSQVVHLRFMAGPKGLGVRRHPQGAEAAYVVLVDELDVSDVVHETEIAVGLPGCRNRIESVADGTIADRMEMALEPEPIEMCDDLLQSGRFDEVDPGIAGRLPVGVAVGLQHGGREVLDHAVEHQLDARRPVPRSHAASAGRSDSSICS